jgi:transcriptional regulator with XRE-family HTH domain
MTIFSPTAKKLTRAIDESGLTQREIAERSGFKRANIISMMKSGETRVPLNRIPALSAVLGMDERDFLIIAIEEYHPGVHEVLVETLGIPLTEAETGILTMFRMATLRNDVEISEPFLRALQGLLDLAAITRIE